MDPTDLPQDIDDYIKESIEISLGLPVSAKNLHLKILASEDASRRLQDQLFVLERRLEEADKRLEKCRAVATMTAKAVKRCVEEKEVMASAYSELVAHCNKLEEDCSLYEGEVEGVTESCHELGKENEELRARLPPESQVSTLIAEVQSLQNDMENLSINLHRAEEVKLLFEENKRLAEENKRLLEYLTRETNYQGSDSQSSASSSASEGARQA